MEDLTIEEIIELTNGEFRGDKKCLIKRPSGITIDSRNIATGEIFFALQGQTTDGHYFVEEALGMGAIAAVIERRNTIPSGPVIIVEDTLASLGSLAQGYRKRFDIQVIGITGSTGKTTVKEMAVAVLGDYFNLHATPGNYNNLIGLPLTVLGLKKRHDVAVIEMGMNRPGEIRRLSEIAQPTIGLVTNAGSAHLEFFREPVEVAQAKGELLEYLDVDSIAIINHDDELLKTQRSRIRGRMVSFGLGEGSDYQGRILHRNKNGCVTFGIEDQVITLSLAGRHNVYNALAVYAAGRVLGLNSHQIKEGFNRVKPVSLRMELLTVGELHIINDAYNANPDSMKAAFEVLGTIEPEKGGRRYAVLGDMLELGTVSRKEHYALGELTASLELSGVFLFGEQMVHTAEGALAGGMPEEKIHYFYDIDDLCESLINKIQKEDIILVKGSRGMRMERVVEYLKESTRIRRY